MAEKNTTEGLGLEQLIKKFAKLSSEIAEFRDRIKESKEMSRELPDLFGRRFGHGYAIKNYRVEDGGWTGDEGGPWRCHIFEATVYGVRVERLHGIYVGRHYSCMRCHRDHFIRAKRSVNEWLIPRPAGGMEISHRRIKEAFDETFEYKGGFDGSALGQLKKIIQKRGGNVTEGDEYQTAIRGFISNLGTRAMDEAVPNAKMMLAWQKDTSSWLLKDENVKTEA
ncbi:hypothetical protein DL768_008483 [Monosporascus sp. mg162]|nr:hypothetical protein DL768_008483 [Monosporascus sp. mg162]